ncbi:MAG: hypothetical protein AAF393_08545 [Pseudomonadota bacterium]
MRLIVLALLILVSAPVQAAEFSKHEWVIYGEDTVFPFGAFDSANPSHDALLNRSHSAVLTAMEEEPFTQMSKAGALIRVTVMPARSTPFVFRVSQSEDGFAVDFKLAWGIATNPGGVKTQDRFELGADAFLSALAALQKMGVCQEAPRATAKQSNSIWIVETLNGPYCIRAYAAPVGQDAVALLAALSSPLRGIPSVVGREMNQAPVIGE